MAFKERYKKVLLMWPVLVIIGVILFGIYFGIMTPAEAAAIGASMALAFTIAYGKLTWEVLRDSLIGTVKTTSMLIFIMVSASIIGGTLALLRVPDLLAEWVTSLSVPPLLILVIIYSMYIVLGCFIDAVSMIVMTLPIVFPIIISLGYDPIWFGIIVVILVEIAMITPPIGLNVYTIHGLRPNLPLSDVVLGSMPFMCIMIVALALLTAFPDIATWLPSTMRR
jgi:tripartite ATP-independent transporter DctM subunit